ncbi:MAG: inositol monophosphatase, partial [Verrucomicrobiae bacterium]|nr:inositol monophosphatase [Verrucomicrobiae bacterium]
YGPVVFPEGIKLEDTRFKAIIDPIDGTRELMYDKRSAWVIAGVAQQRFANNRIGDIEVAMMTELPTTKQRLADQISATRGCGRDGIVCTRTDLDRGTRTGFSLTPSNAADLDHAVATFVKIFPEGKELTSRFETDLWKQLGLFARHRSPVIFDDQYISTGGQMYELLVGHYRFYGDIRPHVLQSLGLGQSLTCHPYDVAGALLLEEAGCVFESPTGNEVDVPMDTVSPVSWVAYANEKLAGLVRPALKDLMEKYFG